MPQDWFVNRGGQQRQGPISASELQSLAKSGKLDPDDLVWKEGMAQWLPARKVKGLFATTPPPLPPIPPPITSPTSSVPPSIAPTEQAIPQSQSGSMAVLVLTIIAGFFSVFVGGCTAATHEGVARFGEGVSDFQRKYGDPSGSPSKTRKDASEIREAGSKYAILGFLQAVLGVSGGVYAFRKYNS
jgi:hypothetical protein